MTKVVHDWYFSAWLKACGKKQADLARDLGWNKAKASLFASGKQAYNRDDVSELADYLNLKPHELLMHPDDAMALRQLRKQALKVVETSEPEPALKKVSSS